MTQPSDLAARVTALEATVKQLVDFALPARTQLQALPPWQAGAVERVTALETAVTEGGQRITALTEAAQGFGGRVNDVELELHQLQEAAAAIGARMTELEAAAQAISGRLDTVAQTVRPGRTVMRQRVDDIQETLAEILARLPETPPNGGTAR